MASISKNLKIRDIRHDKLIAGQDVTFYVDVKNYDRNLESPSFGVYAYCDGDPVGSDKYESSLDPYETREVDLDLRIDKSGTHEIEFKVKIDGDTVDTETEDFKWGDDDDPTHYDYEKKEVHLGGGIFATTRIIKTDLDNIETETILRPISDTSYTGINGGFFAAGNGYDNPPTGSSSICYNKYDKGKTVKVEGVRHPAISEYNKSDSGTASKKTMIIYKDGSRTKATYRYVEEVDDVLSQTRFRDSINIIGGTDYNKSSWSTKAYYGPVDRTVIAWEGNDVYLITVDSVNIPSLKSVVERLGLDPVDSVILDGSGSTCMQVEVNGRLRDYGGDRYIYNMIRLKKDY
ncbi:phosphodiester glycosidase family protein [Wukongibacter baidiensis]